MTDDEFARYAGIQLPREMMDASGYPWVGTASLPRLFQQLFNEVAALRRRCALLEAERANTMAAPPVPVGPKGARRALDL